MLSKISSLYSDKLVKASSLLFIASMVTNVSNYAFQIIMGRLLTPTEYGFMNALLALYTIMAVPVAPLFAVITKKTSEYKAREDFAGISELFRMMNKRIIVTCLICIIVFMACSSFIRDYLHATSIVPVFMLGLAVVTALAYPVNIAILQGVQNFKWISINQGLNGPTKLLLTVVFVSAGFSVNGVMAGMVASGVLLWSLSYIPIREYMLHDRRHKSSVNPISFSHAAPVFLSIFSFAVLTQADMILVSRYFSPHDAGIYASAAILGKAVMYIPGAIVLALFPMVSEHHALNQSSRHLLVKSLIITICISGTAALIFFLFPEFIMRIIYGAKYQEANQLLKYYGFAMLPMAFLMVLMNYLLAKGRGLLSYIMIFGAFMEIIFLILFRGSLMIIVYDLMAAGIIVLCLSTILIFLHSRFSYSPLRETDVNVSN